MKVQIEIEGETFEDILHGLTMVRRGLRQNHCGADQHRGATYMWKSQVNVKVASESPPAPDASAPEPGI